MGFDLSSVETIDTVEIEILHPTTGKPTGIKVQVASYESDRVRDVSRRIANKAMQKQRRKLTAEQVEENTLDLASAAIVSWSGLEKDGKALECNTENAKAVLREYSWFAQQIDEAASDQAAFIKA